MKLSKVILKRSLILLILVNSIAMATAQTILEEVVVTAQKRSQSIQDVPFAITALSQNSLDRSGIGSLEEFAYKVPGLAISGQGNGRTQLNIRGVTAGEIRRDNIRASETVGVYFDEIPLSTALYNPDLEPFDLERVEVLRGPQGTLYGSGSLAGTIRLISKAPVMNEFEGMIDTGFSSIEHGDIGFSVKGAVNVPMIEDTLALRIAAYHTNEGGWIDNISPGPGRGEDVNSSEKTGVRLSLLWTPSARLSIRPTYIHQEIDTNGTPEDTRQALGVQRLVNIGALGATQTFDSGNKYEQWKYLDETYNDEIDIFNLHAQYDFDNLQLTTSSSYSDRDVRVVSDLSANNLAGGFFPGAMGTNVLGINLADNKKIESFAQEIRLASTSESNLQWIIGAYYSDIDIDYSQPLSVVDPAGVALPIYTPFGAEAGQLLNTTDTLSIEQIALFGEANYRLLDKLTATIGLRWFDVKQKFDDRVTGILNGGITTINSVTKEDDINPKFMLAYEASDDVLVSAQAARGFRLGGPQLFVPTVSQPGNDCPGDLAALGISAAPTDGFKSENIWNYELALKSSWSDGRVLFNASVFYIDYSDLQITTRLNCGFSFTTNAGGAESKGVEFEIDVLAMDNLKLSFGGSYTDTELTDDLVSGEANKGDELIYVPNLKFNAALDYSYNLTPTLDGYFSINYQYTGTVEQFYSNSTSMPVNLSRTADAYDTANLRVGIEAEKWEVALFVNNLLDEYGTSYIESVNPGGPGGWVGATILRPRTIGLNAKYRF